LSQTHFYDVDELRNQLKNIQTAYDELLKQYGDMKAEHNRENLYNQAKINTLTKEKGLAEKQADEILTYHETREKELKHSVFEIPCKMLYGLAFRWQEKDDSVFLVVDNEAKEFALRTRDEIEGNEKLDLKGRPVFRHWWKVNVAE